MSKFKRIISLLLAIVSFCVLELANPLQTLAAELNQLPTAETAVLQEIEEPNSLPSLELQESPLVTTPPNPDEPQAELYILVYIAVILTDAKGNTSTYSYGDAESMLRLASLTGAGTGTVYYGYDDYGKLTQISRTSAVYGFIYDNWNRNVAVKVGGVTLSENAYDTYGRLSTTIYANGFSARYVYDALDRVEKIYHTSNGTETLTYTFVYDGEGNLYELRNHKTGRATFFQYDHAGKCMASTEKTFTGTTPTYTGTVSGYTYQYDANNNLSKLTCTTGSTTWSVTYTYDKDNRPTVSTLTSGKTLTNTYDSLGRLTQKRWSLSSNYDTSISYIANADGTQTALVASWKNGSDTAYTYQYDANGNITQISQGSVSVTYAYDAANQLIRENNGFTNQTVTYEYDSWGNILSKKAYAYTTGNLTTPTSTDVYTYGNASWGDQLTAYNGQSIAYDEMGNPTTYLGYTMGWQGKQLISANNGTNNITYTYNEDGLRLTKTVNGTTTNYYYNGSVLISMTTGNTTQQFHYDAAGNAIAVTYNGTEYYYVRNAQGDIVKLIDSTGTTVVEYTYDSWGKLLTTTGSLAITLGNDQPFRYRGYVYDTETQLYYLQTRYYDPTTCRFISSDFALSTGQGVLGHNAYAYCLNNPVNMSDSSGSWPRWATIALGAVAVVTAVVVTVATLGTAAPAAVCTLTAVGMSIGASYAVASTAATVTVVTTTVVAAAYAGDVAYSAVTGDSLLLDKVFQGNTDAYNAGLAIASIATAGMLEMAAQSPGVCFVAGTPVLSACGYIAIEEIEVGDMVWAENPETGEKELKEVVQTFVNKTTELVYVQVDSEEIVTTLEHPFYSPVKGWIAACKLRAGDILVLQSGKNVTVEKVQHKILEAPITVYNLEVADFHTYYVGESSVLVHNTCGRKPTSPNQMQKQVERGQAPSTVVRVDNPKIPGQLPHIHFSDGTAMNIGGSVHDAMRGVHTLTNSERIWIFDNGWGG